MTIDDHYDNIPYHTKESASLPLSFGDLSIDKQIFFRDLFAGILDNREEKITLIEDLEMIKFDLEAVIANVKK
jgi:hypothetical protein